VKEAMIRPATRADFPAVLELARRALAWTDDDEQFLTWKHLENPFGESPMWVALDDDRVIGFRTFMRWEFVTADGNTVRAARAVDTATDPAHQGRGIFTRLTQTAISALSDDRVDLIFNTPNAKSLAGYLKMGWSEVGRLPVAVMPTSWRFPLVIVTARQAATRAPLSTGAGERPADVFADDAVDELLASQPTPNGLRTRRSRGYLLWRYGNDALGYRAVLADDHVERGVAVFRIRRRGRATEVVLCDVLVPDGDANLERALARRVAHLGGADYVLRIGARPVTADPFLRIPRIGPVLACRSLTTSAPTALSAWQLTMGDVELF
jgi:GNAT superfamily N-acetyltransferase